MKRLLVGAVVLASFSAFAQVEQKASEKRVPKQEVIFTPHDLTGTRDEGTGILVFAAPKHHFDSMVKVRANFQPELQRSADAL